MVQPFNYMLNVQDPSAAFLQSFKAGNAIFDMQRQRQDAERKRAEAEQLRAALGQIGPNATPQQLLDVTARFPAFGEQLTARYKTFDEPRKAALFDAGKRAFAVMQPSADGTIAADAAVRELETSAAAFENSGQPDIAKQLRDTARAVQINPGAGRQAIGMMLAWTDADQFKKFSDATNESGLTSFQKDLAASGIDPASDEGKQLSRQYVINRSDPIVEMTTPSGAKFIGPMSEYTRRYGQQPDAGARLPTPKSKAEFDALPAGAQFVAPDGSVRRKP